jgi:hypothetical protein
MNPGKRQLLLTRLADERGKQVIFVSHCLLNENTRYLGGAFRRGGVDEIIAGFQQAGVGLCQMHCPEQRAWGGVLKPWVLPMYGAQGTLRYHLRPLLFPLFTWYTRWVYWRLAKAVVRDIADYVRSGFEVVGIVGIGGSPSCGVWATLDLRRSLGAVAACPVAQLDRQQINKTAIADCLREGPGWYMEAIQRRLRRKRLIIPWFEHHLLAEMQGQQLPLRTQQ